MPVIVSELLVIAAKFFRSGLFFMLFGTLFLLFAHREGPAAHSALTFIVVVIGSAIVLYGTGTQAAGDLNSDPSAASKYKLTIAGGAGVMSLVIAYGIVEKGATLKGVFRPERQIYIVKLEAKPNLLQQPIQIAEYNIEAYAGDIEIPFIHKNKYVELYIPVLNPNENMPIRINLTLKNPEKKIGAANPNPTYDQPLEIKSSDQTGGVEFRRIAQPIRIDLINAVNARTETISVVAAEPGAQPIEIVGR